MPVTVRLFARLREIAGTDELSRPVGDAGNRGRRLAGDDARVAGPGALRRQPVVRRQRAVRAHDDGRAGRR